VSRGRLVDTRDEGAEVLGGDVCLDKRQLEAGLGFLRHVEVQAHVDASLNTALARQELGVVRHRCRGGEGGVVPSVLSKLRLKSAIEADADVCIGRDVVREVQGLGGHSRLVEGVAPANALDPLYDRVVDLDVEGSTDRTINPGAAKAAVEDSNRHLQGDIPGDRRREMRHDRIRQERF